MTKNITNLNHLKTKVIVTAFIVAVLAVLLFPGNTFAQSDSGAFDDPSESPGNTSDVGPTTTGTTDNRSDGFRFDNPNDRSGNGGDSDFLGAGSGCNNSEFLGFPTWYKYLSVTSDGSGGCNVELPQKDGETDVITTVAAIGFAIFEILLRISAFLAIGFVIYGGYKYMLSQGEPDRLKGARSTIINALIGLVISILSVAIVNLIAGSIT